MNKQLLLALQKRSNERLVELRTQVENPELRAEDLPAIQEEIDEINKQLQEVADALANLEDDGGGEEGNEDNEEGDEGSGTEGSGEGGEGRASNTEGGENRNGLTPEQRSAAMAAIATGLSTRGHKTTKKKEKEIRSAFANFVVGRISEAEARSLGIEAGNGSVTIPEVIASEIITYAQEENLLRKYGSVHKTAGDMKYPVLVKKADANVRKKERKDSDEIVATD
ncbi:phage major capsid protein, partial [Bacillus thuringiensis]